MLCRKLPVFSHIRVAAGVVHLRALALGLLGGAGHDGDHEHLVGVDAHLLGEIALGHRAEHLLGGLGGGEAVRIGGILALQEADPAGAAGGEHGPAVLAPVGEALDELAALLHDGEVGGEVGVEDIVKAHVLQSGDDAAGGGVLGAETPALCPGHPHGGGHLDHGGDLRVRQGLQHPAGIVPDGEGPGGAVGDALAAEGAVRVLQVAAVADGHGGPGAGADLVPDMHLLDLVADLDAAHALDTFAGLPDHGGVQADGGALQLDGVGLVVDVQVVGELLELAVAAADADGAVGVVLGEDETQVGPPGLAHLGGVAADDHALRHPGVAGGLQALGALHLHHAHAAGGDLVDILQVAEVGDGDVGGLGRLQDGGPLRDPELSSVQFDGHHFSSLPPLKFP